MAAISIPHSDPWVVARWAFRRLLERAAERLHDPADVQALEQAIALDGLHFDLLDQAQASRLAVALEVASDQLREELSGAHDDPRDIEFAEALALLEMRLHDIHE